MGSKSKRLGKGFEYEVRDILRNATGLNFERTPHSGAWVGGVNAAKAEYVRSDATEIMSGDLICPQNWRWSIECKNEADVPVHHLFLTEKCEKVNEFLEQAYTSAKVAKKEPLLIMKYRKNGYSLPKRIKEVLKEANINPPKTNTVTFGILVAEEADKCFDIAGINHIYYTANFSNNITTAWCFFDIENWLHLIGPRQFL